MSGRLRSWCFNAVMAGLAYAHPAVCLAAEPAAPTHGASAGFTRTYAGPGLAAFKKGWRAWELKDWRSTVTLMAEALRADPDHPNMQVRPRSQWLTPYVPSYYLSLARCKLGQCDVALTESGLVLSLIKDARGYIQDRYKKDCVGGCPAPGTRETAAPGEEPRSAALWGAEGFGARCQYAP